MPEVTTPVVPVTPPAAAPKPGTPPVGGRPPAQAATVTPKDGGKPPDTSKGADEELMEFDGKKYTKGQVRAFLKRGEEGSKLMSTAAQRMQEAEARLAEVEKREAVFKSGDRKAIFAELRKMGHDPRTMSEAEILDAMEEEKLTPEQKKIREYEQKLKEKEDAEAEAKRKEEEEKQSAEVEQMTQTLAQTFVNALESKGIPLSHARALLPTYAQIVHAYDRMGREAPLDLVAETLAEQDAKTFERHLGSLDVDAILQRLGPEKEKALIKRAVARYNEQRTQKAGGVLPGGPAPKPVTSGGIPPWMSKAPADVRRAYFNDGGEKSPTVSKWLATQQRG